MPVCVFVCVCMRVFSKYFHFTPLFTTFRLFVVEPNRQMNRPRKIADRMQHRRTNRIWAINEHHCKRAPATEHRARISPQQMEPVVIPAMPTIMHAQTEIAKSVHCAIVLKRPRAFIRCSIVSILRAVHAWKAICTLKFSNHERKLRAHSAPIQCIRVTLKHCCGHRRPFFVNMKISWCGAFCWPIRIRDGVRDQIAGKHINTILLAVGVGGSYWRNKLTCGWVLFFSFSAFVAMPWLQADVPRVRASNVNALAVMWTFAIIAKLNGIRTKRAMRPVHHAKVQCALHRAA